MENFEYNPFEIFCVIMGMFLLMSATMAIVEGSTYSEENHCGQRILSEITGEPLEDVLFEVGYGRTYPYDLWVYLRHHGYPNATYGVGRNPDAQTCLYKYHWKRCNEIDTTGYEIFNIRGWIKLE